MPTRGFEEGDIREDRMTDASSGDGTPANPWQLKTPPLTSDYTMHRDVKDEKDVIVCTAAMFRSLQS